MNGAGQSAVCEYSLAWASPGWWGPVWDCLGYPRPIRLGLAQASLSRHRYGGQRRLAGAGAGKAELVVVGLAWPRRVKTCFICVVWGSMRN